MRLHPDHEALSDGFLPTTLLCGRLSLFCCNRACGYCWCDRGRGQESVAESYESQRFFATHGWHEHRSAGCLEFDCNQSSFFSGCSCLDQRSCEVKLLQGDLALPYSSRRGMCNW
uniref:Uncharacterized protein n=1 Tax=Physcomitrium patens TaxID=3218 RepID=A0A2K1IMK3_PHYPA|nr:hypothetical protein PHYPA_026823 [Physcomitrium patens]